MSLAQAAFDAQIGGLAVALENFESYPSADFASPFGIANGTFTSVAPRVQGQPTLCGDVDQCLFDSTSTGDIRTFFELAARRRVSL